MQNLHNNGARRCLGRTNLFQVNITRDASLTSAISRGIRKATGGVDRLGTRRRRDDDEENARKYQPLVHDGENRFAPHGQSRSFVKPQDYPDPTRSSRPRYSDERQPSRGGRDFLQDRPNFRTNNEAGRTGFDNSRPTLRGNLNFREDRVTDSISDQSPRPKVASSSYGSENYFGYSSRPSRTSQLPRSRFELERFENAGSKSEARARRELRKRPVKIEINAEAPQGVPYTTAGSDFVYGTFAVRAALEAKRRRLYKLYKWAGEKDTRDEHDHSIALLAKSQKIPIEYVAGSWDKMLMKMSGQRPHNGYVLEASPVPKLPVTALCHMKEISDDLRVRVATQSLEDGAANQIFNTVLNEAVIPRHEAKSHFPLLLWLDRITDTGNIGAIIRSAYFFGVDAILIPEHGTAPFNPVTIKASAGAAEHVPILLVKKEIDFVRASQENGWRFFAAAAPDSASTKKKHAASKPSFIEHEALGEAPSVLMVGNEGEGLRAFLQQAADESVSIDGIRSSASGVDSLNVSVAAALLMARFLIKPQPVSYQQEHKPAPSSAATLIETNDSAPAA